MKSIQTKIIALILVGIMVSVGTISSIAIVRFYKVIDNDTSRIMNLTCSEKAEELNNIFGKIQQSVKILAVHSVEVLESIEKLQSDEEYSKSYIKHIDELGLTVANQTEGAISVYARFNPEFTSSQSGFFRVKDSENNQFKQFEMTDLLKYEKDDIEHVGWYYIPVEAGEAIWIQPYYNQNIDVYIISYVIPVYKDGQLLGIVGMDIDFNFITKECDSIHICDTGSAFLADENFQIIHSKYLDKGTYIEELSENLAKAKKDDIVSKDTLYDYTIHGVKKKVALCALDNGMCLAVSAPVSELYSLSYKLIIQIIATSCVAVVIFICVAWGIARTIIKPLRELNVAAQQIADGNLDVPLACQSKDEVGTLSKSLQKTARQLKLRIDYINNLAYIDKLTGINNNTAYLHEVSFIKEKMLQGNPEFSVFIVDVNGLKTINDTYGHEYGNKLIIKAAQTLSEVFGAEHVYRIGGDEFAALIKNGDEEKCSQLLKKFESLIQNEKGEIRLCASIGGAVYDAGKDKDYESVFKRADKEMYQKKIQMKERGENSRIVEKADSNPTPGLAGQC